MSPLLLRYLPGRGWVVMTKDGCHLDKDGCGQKAPKVYATRPLARAARQAFQEARQEQSSSPRPRQA